MNELIKKLLLMRDEYYDVFHNEPNLLFVNMKIFYEDFISKEFNYNFSNQIYNYHTTGYCNLLGWKLIPVNTNSFTCVFYDSIILNQLLSSRHSINDDELVRLYVYESPLKSYYDKNPTYVANATICKKDIMIYKDAISKYIDLKKVD